ncbi:hypothetical protein PM082_007585 [Marasmius tenuissimus]|nr:hypothetical protein PM082_007585 [Marasmius tenuissimus]
MRSASIPGSRVQLMVPAAAAPAWIVWMVSVKFHHPSVSQAARHVPQGSLPGVVLVLIALAVQTSSTTPPRACAPLQGSCTTSSDCCDGNACQFGVCTPAQCAPPGYRCDLSDPGACCNFICNNDFPHPVCL